MRDEAEDEDEFCVLVQGYKPSEIVSITDDFDEWADEMADENILADVPEKYRFYFDYKAWRRDLMMDYNLVDLPNGKTAILC